MEFVKHRSRDVHTLFGWIKVERAYYHCPDCGDSYVPYDIASGLGSSQLSPGLSKVCCTLAKPDHHEQLVRDWTEMVTLLLQTVSTPGELGTVANLEQHSRLCLKVFAGRDAELPASYKGKPRLVVPTVLSLVTKGEPLKINIIALDKHPMTNVAVHVRPLGTGKWKTIAVSHLARARYQAVVPAVKDDFEYFVSAVSAGGQDLILARHRATNQPDGRGRGQHLELAMTLIVTILPGKHLHSLAFMCR